MQHFTCHLDGSGYARLERVVGVYEEDRGISVNLGISLESIVFSIEKHDPTVCHCAHYRDVKQLTCKHGGSTMYAAYVCRTCTINRCIHIMRATCSHVCHTTSFSRSHNAVRLCSNKALVVDLREQESLNELGFNDGCCHGH